MLLFKSHVNYYFVKKITWWTYALAWVPSSWEVYLFSFGCLLSRKFNIVLFVSVVGTMLSVQDLFQSSLTIS